MKKNLLNSWINIVRKWFCFIWILKLSILLLLVLKELNGSSPQRDLNSELNTLSIFVQCFNDSTNSLPKICDGYGYTYTILNLDSLGSSPFFICHAYTRARVGRKAYKNDQRIRLLAKRKRERVCVGLRLINWKILAITYQNFRYVILKHKQLSKIKQLLGGL